MRAPAPALAAHWSAGGSDATGLADDVAALFPPFFPLRCERAKKRFCFFWVASGAAVRRCGAARPHGGVLIRMSPAINMSRDAVAETSQLVRPRDSTSARFICTAYCH